MVFVRLVITLLLCVQFSVHNSSDMTMIMVDDDGHMSF